MINIKKISFIALIALVIVAGMGIGIAVRLKINASPSTQPTEPKAEATAQPQTEIVSTAPSPASASSNEIYAVTVRKDIPYGSASDLTLKLDVYTPNGTDGATPAVIFIHGGGFHGGSKNGVADEAEMLASYGVAVVAVDYRLSDTAIFPAPLHDVKGVVRFIKAHASEYNINPDAIFALGESAGGVLASLLGVTENDPSLEGDIGGNLGYSSDIAGVVNISGSYVASIVDTMSSGIKRSIGRETGCDPVPSPECASTYQALSAETYISSDDAPFLILHGDQDQSVPLIQATTLNDELLTAGVSSEIYVGAGYGHVEGLLAHFMPEVINFINANGVGR
ncbi:MAG: hypothetical protein DCC56_05890 [Anaerolineae bacterium]|nr:MAG: hypothetical protein DCC56_05890 [Anaerolineae bacterium]WKZ43614.1 MAG: alpha/beta hydrolase [Anaerolineales bacterium]